MLKYRLFIRDDRQNFLSGFNVSVSIKDPPLEWLIRKAEVYTQPCEFFIPKAKGMVARMIIRGPANPKQPDIVNWSTEITLSRQRGGDINIVLPRCKEQICASCTSLHGRETHLGLPMAPLPEEGTEPASNKAANDGAVQSGPITLGCVRMSVEVRDKNGNPMTDYLGLLHHHSLPSSLIDIYEIGFSKFMHIRNARHPIESIVWRAGDRKNTLHKVEFYPTEEIKNGLITIIHKLP